MEYNTAKQYVIETPSAVNPFRNCLLGVGDTEQQAWEEAFGPKPWSPYTRKAARRAWVREVTHAEAAELLYNSH